MTRVRTHGFPLLQTATLVVALGLAACAPAAPGSGTTASQAAPTSAAPTSGAPTDAAPTDAAPTEAAPTEAPSPSPSGGGAGMLVTISTVEPITWYGQRCDPLSPEWVVSGVTESEGYKEVWTYRATIDRTTHKGTYTYEANGELDAGTIVKSGSGEASVVVAVGTETLKVADTEVTGTIYAPGTTATVTLPVPGTEFVFRAARREDCD